MLSIVLGIIFESMFRDSITPVFLLTVVLTELVTFSLIGIILGVTEGSYFTFKEGVDLLKFKNFKIKYSNLTIFGLVVWYLFYTTGSILFRLMLFIYKLFMFLFIKQEKPVKETYKYLEEVSKD